MSSEDEIVEYIMDRDPPWEINFEVEVPYNYYGSRGVVDLVECAYSPDSDEMEEWANHYNTLTPTKTALRIYEVKSEYAIHQSTGANEVLRQFRNHQEYFFEGSDHTRSTYDSVEFWIVFEDTNVVREHVRSNVRKYRNENSVSFFDLDDMEHKTFSEVIDAD